MTHPSVAMKVVRMRMKRKELRAFLSCTLRTVKDLEVEENKVDRLQFFVPLSLGFVRCSPYKNENPHPCKNREGHPRFLCGSMVVTALHRRRKLAVPACGSSASVNSAGLQCSPLWRNSLTFSKKYSRRHIKTLTQTNNVVHG